ncbi:hypothetical protein CVT24_003339 [Panaeolus cyanescens]|uniref:Uncharacterized protein n=1 Tax=Panaeolus cyanescens TaxID=181874 RepID=A0A409Y758_9AGAR|nr:hypothetical protein CVT24_003339 [Panaeolus cyanescens]
MPATFSQSASPALHARAAANSKRALTPIIAGSVCGGVMLIAWIIGFAIYFRKRYNRKKRNRLIAEGKASPREKDLRQPEEKIVIPPDPAVLLGQRKPGEVVFPEGENSRDSPLRVPWSRHGSHYKPQIHTENSGSSAHLNPKQLAPSSSADRNSIEIIEEVIVPSRV